MAEKDIKSKILMSYADVFADCINTLVYGGRQRLNGENTHRAPTESFYKGKGEKNQFCDVGRYLIEESHIIVEYILHTDKTYIESRLQTASKVLLSVALL